jgi:hypothetical protein
MKGRILRAPVSTSSYHSAPTVATVMESIRQIAFSAELLYHHLYRIFLRFYHYAFPTSWNIIQTYSMPTRGIAYSLCTITTFSNPVMVTLSQG